MEWIGSRIPEQPTSTPSWTPDTSFEPTKMRLAYFSNEFPHDDLKDLLRHLHVHSRDIRYPTLARFIHQATLAVHEEVRLLPVNLRMLVPSFETVFNLADHAALRNGPLGGAVDGMLLCAVQLATLIGQVFWGCFVLLGSDSRVQILRKWSQRGLLPIFLLGHLSRWLRNRSLINSCGLSLSHIGRYATCRCRGGSPRIPARSSSGRGFAEFATSSEFRGWPGRQLGLCGA